MPVLKGRRNSSKALFFCETLTKIQTKQEKLNFLKTEKTRFSENFEFRWLFVSLKRKISQRQLLQNKESVESFHNANLSLIPRF